MGRVKSMPVMKSAASPVPAAPVEPAMPVKKAGPKRRVKPQLVEQVPDADMERVVMKGARKPRRFHPGTVALREIRRYQKGTAPVLPRAPFFRLMREIQRALNPAYLPYGATEFNWKKEAVDAMQESAEAYLIELFSDSVRVAVDSGHEGVEARHMKLVRALRHGAL